MKNNKFLKALLALGLVVVSAASAIGIAACDPGKGGGNDGFDLGSIVVPAPKLPEYTGPAAALQAGKSEVKYTFLGDDLEVGTYSEGWSNGTFSIPSGTKVRNKSSAGLKGVYKGSTPVEGFSDVVYMNSIHMGDNTSALTLNAPAPGTLYIHVQNGSGSADTQSIYFIKPNGTETIEYDGKKVDNKTQRIELPVTQAGEYTIKRVSGTTDLLYAEFNVSLDNTPIERIEVVNKGKSDYLLTQGLDCTGIKVNAVHADTGKISEVNLSNVEFNVSNYNAKASGTYSIGLSYEVASNLTSPTTTFTTTYDVNVYTVSSIKLGTTLTNNEKQTTVKQAYLPGEQLDTTGLTVTATGTLGSKNVDFKMSSKDYTVTAPNLTVEGKKEVEISVAKAYANGANVKESYGIVVKAKKDPTAGEISLNVGGATGDFDTVTQALCYLKACNYDDNTVKTLNIADGEYYEKISIDIPNVHLIGSATKTPNATTDNGVVLWYDAANGLSDPSGVAYGTKGSSSVTVAKTANGFVAENITFKNYYNNAEVYYALKEKTGGTQAVALMIESSNSILRNCKLTSYQDTLYANTGYQFYEHCWIEGRTDYIFGQNAIPYFYECTIYTVSAGAKDGDGGYIVAYQNTSNEYGPVFNKCTITGAETGATNIALGRAWGAEFTMVTLNCKISATVYSKAPHTSGTKKGERYVHMEADPKPANMLEYNNFMLNEEDPEDKTPDLTTEQKAALAGTCTFMSADQAAKYQIENVATLLKFNPYA